MPSFQILCLANSFKYRGRCIAGLRKDGLGWIRPVSSQLHGTLFPSEYQLPNQQEPRLLDILEIDFVRPLPEVHQPENWLINTTPWRLIDRLDTFSLTQKQKNIDFLQSIVSTKPYIFNNFDQRIPYNHLLSNPLESSLILVKPEKLSFKITTEPEWKLKASFYLKDSHYYLPVTDPIFIKKMQNFSDGDYRVEELALPGVNCEHIFLTISLGEPYYDYCYKLVAAVISIG